MDPKTHIQQPRPRDNFKAWEDPLFSDLRRIFSRAKLREVLTHSSFYEKEGRGNSRWVFAGMFVFKGQVAAVLHQYFSGDGTRLQHILGNLFRTERLQRMYNEWRLCQFVRAGDGFDIESHKHIFVYAILGYVSSQEENLRNWFIGKYILSDDVRHLLTHRKRNRDLMAQADEIVRQMDGRRLSLEMSRTEEGLHVASAVLSDGTVLCLASSKSWRYARTKAAKMALNLLAAPGRKALLSNPEYQARMLARMEEEKARRTAAIAERDAAKKALREKWEAERAAIAKDRDAKRRASQAEAKKRKAENAARAAAKAAKEARPMSANKRRFLEDKKK
ncbi:MAG: hypothetical protein IJ714_05170 [Bacteroidales bacterium]|nr:hypothetical protein [Bacteroidales bacterium]